MAVAQALNKSRTKRKAPRIRQSLRDCPVAAFRDNLQRQPDDELYRRMSYHGQPWLRSFEVVISSSGYSS